MKPSFEQMPADMRELASHHGEKTGIAKIKDLGIANVVLWGMDLVSIFSSA